MSMELNQAGGARINARAGRERVGMDAGALILTETGLPSRSIEKLS